MPLHTKATDYDNVGKQESATDLIHQAVQSCHGYLLMPTQLHTAAADSWQHAMLECEFVLFVPM